ncbi:syntaxin-18-like [Haliotis rufescens]|uniref:syntaxin-18-like n=1 Tax=Haliotis rufescens TaxID=6454 RepID=UPI00201F8EA2|nr:syntaxin-18-like [Haliotis rufescens]
MDITNLFKATVKAVKSRNKVIGEPDNDKSTILSTKRKKGDFEVKAKDVVNTITKLRDFLLQHRKEYVNAGSHLATESSKMTDSDRDQIDTDSQQIIKKCQETISMFRQEANSQRVHPQVKEHRQSVMVLIGAYLKVVCKIYSEQRAVRVKRVVDRKRISRLEPERRMHIAKHLEDNADPRPQADVKQSEKSEKSRVALEKSSHADDDDEISPEEAQMFEQENQTIYNEMNSMSDEVRQIEGKVVEIAKLQEIFSEKVLEQEKDIDRIANTAVGSTENIKDANEEIREAIKKKAEFRVWILFFLVVCSFSLLFLDWYNG